MAAGRPMISPIPIGTQCVAGDQSAHVSGPRAERDADGNLAPAVGDPPRRKAVEPDGGQYERRAAKHQGQRRAEPFLRHRARHQLVHRRHRPDYDVGVVQLDRPFDSGQEGDRVAGRSHEQRIQGLVAFGNQIERSKIVVIGLTPAGVGNDADDVRHGVVEDDLSADPVVAE